MYSFNGIAVGKLIQFQLQSLGDVDLAFVNFLLLKFLPNCRKWSWHVFMHFYTRKARWFYVQSRQCSESDRVLACTYAVLSMVPIVKRSQKHAVAPTYEKLVSLIPVIRMVLSSPIFLMSALPCSHGAPSITCTVLQLLLHATVHCLMMQFCIM